MGIATRSALILSLVFYAMWADAQVLDSVFPSTEKSRYIYAEQLYELDTSTQLEDTVHEFGHRIHPLVKSEVGFLDLGYMATPAQTFRLTRSPYIGFDPGVHVMDPLFFHPDSIKYYNSPTPRTFLKYGQGTKELIYLEASHSQNVFDRWSFGLDYRRIKAQNWHYDNLNGFTLARIPNNYNMQFWSRFFTQNRKYEVIVNYTRNTATIAETGGMIDLAKYDTLNRREKQYFNSVYLPDAHNRFRNNIITATQFFRFGKTTLKITENPDTVGVMDTVKQFSPRGQFYHRIRYNNDNYRFLDPNPNMNYYPVRLLSLSTMDSFRVRNLSNKIGVFFLPSEKAPRFDAAIQHDLIHVFQSGLIDQKFQQVWLLGKLTQPIKASHIDLTGRYGALGYNAGDIHLTGELVLRTKDSSKSFIQLFGRYSRYEASYQQNYFVSNHYSWYHRWNKQEYALLKADGSWKGILGLRLAAERFSNPVVYNEEGLPQQFGPVQILSAQINNKLNFWRFHLVSNGLVKVTPSNSPIRYPLLTVKESFYYEGYFFKKNMLARIGTDFFYYSAFDANYYNPATRQYQLSDLTIGNYPMFDLYFNAKVRTVDLFVVYRHASAGLFGNAYYASPRYPQIPSSIRLGLSWRLFN